MARAWVRWLRSEEGGRPAHPPGPLYAATAVFVLASDDTPVPATSMRDKHVSIVLDAGPGEAFHEEGLLFVDFLAPELVRAELRVHGRIVIMEGARRVAVATVTDLLPPEGRG